MKPKKVDIQAMTEHYKRENRVSAITTLKNPVAYPVGSAMEKLARKTLGIPDGEPVNIKEFE